MKSSGYSPFNLMETKSPVTDSVAVGASCCVNSSLLMLHSTNDRSSNLYLAGEAINLSSDFPLPPTEKNNLLFKSLFGYETKFCVSSTDGWPLSVDDCITHLNNYTGQYSVI